MAAVSLKLVVLGLVVLLADTSSSAKESNNNNQPLAGLEKVLKQVSSVKAESIVDNKMANNVTSTLNEMAMNLRRMFVENRRLNQQVQELVTRVQNTTGLNATSTIGSLQQQTPNLSSLSNSLGNMNMNSLNLTNLSTLMPRFNVA